jgi:hypothetical protein
MDSRRDDAPELREMSMETAPQSGHMATIARSTVTVSLTNHYHLLTPEEIFDALSGST